MSEIVPSSQLPVSRPLSLPVDAPITSDQRRRLREPVIAGGITILVFVVGFIVWASLFSVAGGVPAPGVIVVADSRKTVDHFDGGVISKILVHDGDTVTKGQPLLLIDDTRSRAEVDVIANQYDGLLAQRARLEAELAERASVVFPPELTSRRSDPRVARLMKDQETLFRASRGVYTSQLGVLNQRVQQLNSQADGLKAQVGSVDEQARLNKDELAGVQSLYDKGFAPKSRLLALQRNGAALTGERGARDSQLAGVGQAVGEARIQEAQLHETRATQAADVLRQAQVQIADLVPRLRNAQAQLDRTVIRSPSSGVVVGQTHFTEGGVIRAGERILDVVPQNTPLVVRITIRPDEIASVKAGMKAQVRLTAFHSRTIPPVDAKVLRVSADRITNEKGEPFFWADLAIDQGELARLPGVKLEPGMPAAAIIVTGERSILNYLVSPFTDTFRGALHEN